MIFTYVLKGVVDLWLDPESVILAVVIGKRDYVDKILLSYKEKLPDYDLISLDVVRDVYIEDAK